MGLFDYFSKDAAAKRRKESCEKKLSNMFYQKQDRMAAAEIAADLVRQGDDDGIRILLVRFDHSAQNTTVDAEEKNYVVDLLVSLGDRVAEPIAAHVRRSHKPVYWSIRVLEELWSRDKVGAFLAEVLEATDNGYWRDPAKKIGLIQIAEAYSDDRLGEALVPFLDDHTEEIRFKTIDCMLRNDYAAAQSALVERMASGEEEANRVKARLAEGLAQKAWDLGEHTEAVTQNLPAGFRVTKNVVARG